MRSLLFNLPFISTCIYENYGFLSYFYIQLWCKILLWLVVMFSWFSYFFFHNIWKQDQPSLCPSSDGAAGACPLLAALPALAGMPAALTADFLSCLVLLGLWHLLPPQTWCWHGAEVGIITTWQRFPSISISSPSETLKENECCMWSHMSCQSLPLK